MIEKIEIGNAMLYHGDCLDILSSLSPVDAVITDPPYNVGLNYSGGDNRADYAEWCRAWFQILPAPVKAISCGIANLQVWEKPTWVLCWHKPAAMGRCAVGFNNWEPVLLYGKTKKQVVDVFKACIVPNKEVEGHPCPKPEAWAKWLISALADEGQTILDPFMGTGTTGVAAVKMGLKFVGIEIDRKYFDISCERIEQAQKQQALDFVPR